VTIVNNPPRSWAALARPIHWPARALLFAAFSSLLACGSSEPPPPSTGGGGPGPPGGVAWEFRSGFEAGVTLRPPEVAEGEWEQYITGADEGYDWSSSLPQRPTFRENNRFTYLVSADKDLAQYAETRIETVTGHDGRPTRALYMELKKQDPSTQTGTRVEFGIYPPTEATQAYAKMRLKFQPNLATDILPVGLGRSLQIMEWREQGNDFRFALLVRRSTFVQPEKLFWYIKAQFGAHQNDPVAWDVISEVPVPVGEWFLFEVFWKLDRTDGRFWAAANGETIADYQGQTKMDSYLYVWWPFKVYVGTVLEEFGGKPIYEWVDDVEFASEPPSPLSAMAREGSFASQTYQPGGARLPLE
jgi:hypothetical protein